MAKENLFSKVISRLSLKKGPLAQETQRFGLPQLRFVFFIVGWKQFNIISDVFEKEKVRFHIINQGMGTANSDILNLLGVGVENKAIIACLEQAGMIPVLLKEIRKELGAKSPGQGGIAFTIPLSAINDPLLLIFKQSIYEIEKLTASATSVNTKKKEET